MMLFSNMNRVRKKYKKMHSMWSGCAVTAGHCTSSVTHTIISM